MEVGDTEVVIATVLQDDVGLGGDREGTGGPPIQGEVWKRESLGTAGGMGGHPGEGLEMAEGTFLGWEWGRCWVQKGDPREGLGTAG